MTTGTSSDAAGGPPRRSGRSSRPPDPARTRASSSTSSTEVGRVGRPHGLDGAFHVTRPDGIVDGLTTSLGVLRVGGTAAKPVVRIDGVESREAAEALRGTPILAEVPLEEGEVWADDLVGLRVVDGEVEVGVVERVLAYPSCEVLVVGVTSPADPSSRASKGETLLVPFVDDAVRSVGDVVDVDLGFLGAG